MLSIDVDRKVDEVRDSLAEAFGLLGSRKRPLRSASELLKSAASAFAELQTAMEELRMPVLIVRVEEDGLEEKLERSRKSSKWRSTTLASPPTRRTRVAPMH